MAKVDIDYFTDWKIKSLPPKKRKEEAAKLLLNLADFWKNQVQEAKENIAAEKELRYSVHHIQSKKNPFDDNEGYLFSGLQLKPGIETGEFLQERLEEVQRRKDRTDQQIEEALSAVTTPKAKEAIELVHLKGKTAPEAGRILGVTDRHIRRLKAIGYQEMKLPDEWNDFFKVNDCVKVS